MALLIVIPRSHYNALVNLLSREAGYDWDKSKELHAIAIDGGCGESEADKVFQYCQANDITEVLVPSRIHVDEQSLREAGYSVILGPRVKNILLGNGLTKRLAERKLDWRSKVLGRVQHFFHGTIDGDAVDRWLEQFERLGHRDVGTHLLQMLDVLSTAELGHCVCESSDFLDSDLVVGFSQSRWGKSWSVVSNLIKKGCPSADLRPISEAFEVCRYPKMLRLVEDGLFSGAEVCSVLDDLRGADTSRHEEVAKLTDPSLLAQISTQLHFGAICDFGEHVVRRYTALNKLPNIQISIGPAVRRFRVLVNADTRQATPSLDRPDKDFKDYLYRQLVPFAFQPDKGWRDEDARMRAMRFCEDVGAQLWGPSVRRKFGDRFDGSLWPDDRIKRCALGMDGLGLAFAFPHSVPRATLPIFWAGGDVTIDGRTVNWIPLFPKADK